MSTLKITLTDQFQLVTNKTAFIQSKGGDFAFCFSENTPTQDNPTHLASELYIDGTLGKLWARKQYISDVILIVSEATS